MISSLVLDARTATPHFPGIGRYVTNLARCLATQLSDDERLILLRAPGIEPPVGLSDLVTGIEIAASPFSISQQWAVPRALARHDAALYHSPYLMMPYRPGRPAIVTVYDLIPMRVPRQSSQRARLVFRWAMRLALHASRRCIVISGSTAADLRRHFGVRDSKMCVIPLAADPIFRPSTAAALERASDRYALPPSYFFSLGSNKPHKNLVRLVEAWDLLGEHAPDLIIAGPWDERFPEARQRASELSIAEHIRWLGPVAEPDLPALYGGAAGFVFPSLYEGFGLPVLEAMACGTPVLCSDTSSLPEVAGDAAIRFDPRSAGAIAAAVERLMQERGLSRELAGRGLARSALFTWEETARRHLALYRQTIDETSRADR